MAEMLVCDEIRNKIGAAMITGRAICGSPFEMTKIIDYTGKRGSGSNLYNALVFQLPNWNFIVKKVDEWMVATPSFEYYKITVAEKQRLQETIKAGLTSAAQAVADYELLAHDARRYKEILDYFKKGMKDDHILRSLFVDRVDAYTGEGYSLVTMARRWPTIITDFIRMKEEWTDPAVVPEKEQVDKIRKELDVSQAEATVLKTKNELYREWKKMFFPVVKERYARIQNMVNARKKSIEAYKEWLKPYVARFKMMREEEEKNPAAFIEDPYITPGFGQSQARVGVKLWFWKSFYPSEFGKVPIEPSKKRHGFMIDPYDDFVKEHIPDIEERYNVKITDEIVEQILEDAIKLGPDRISVMNPDSLYYMFFEATVDLNLVKTPPPEGVELDDLVFNPIRAWWMSQNVLLLHLIELKARQMAFEKYVNELIGAEKLEKDIFKEIEKQFEEEKKLSKTQEFLSKIKKTKEILKKIEKPLDKVVHTFILKGPYETTFYERVSKGYARGIGGAYGQVIGHIEKTMGVY
jgi:hypothetical protein